MTIKTRKKTKQKLNFTENCSNQHKNYNEQGFWHLKIVLPSLGNQEEPKKYQSTVGTHIDGLTQTNFET